MDWDQWEIMQRYVAKEARGEQGKRGEPKVNRWIREMMYDYENSRWHWAMQVYAVHGVLADMSERTPQNVAWRAYVDSCIYDGCYKVMNTVRIWGFNMSNQKELTFKSGGLKVIMYALGNLWEQVG